MIIYDRIGVEELIEVLESLFFSDLLRGVSRSYGKHEGIVFSRKPLGNFDDTEFSKPGACVPSGAGSDDLSRLRLIVVVMPEPRSESFGSVLDFLISWCGKCYIWQGLFPRIQGAFR